MKKIKTGTIVEWSIFNKWGDWIDVRKTRSNARMVKNDYNIRFKENSPHRIAKSVVTK